MRAEPAYGRLRLFIAQPPSQGLHYARKTGRPGPACLRTSELLSLSCSCSWCQRLPCTARCAATTLLYVCRQQSALRALQLRVQTLRAAEGFSQLRPISNSCLVAMPQDRASAQRRCAQDSALGMGAQKRCAQNSAQGASAQRRCAQDSALRIRTFGTLYRNLVLERHAFAIT